MKQNSFLSILLIVLFVCLSACSESNDQKNVHFQKADQLFDDGLYRQAGEEYRQILQLDPKDTKANFQMGQVSEAIQDWKAAFEFYNKTLQLDEKNILARVKIGQLHLIQKNITKARQEAETALSHSPEHADAIAFMGTIELQQRNLLAAKKYADKALSRQADNVNANILMSGVLLEENNIEQATNLLLNVINKHPKEARLKTILSGIYVSQGEHEKAIDLMNSMVQSWPDSLGHRVRLTAIYTSMNDIDKAEETLRKAVVDLKDNDQIELLLVKFLADHRGQEVAIFELESMLEQQADNEAIQTALVRAYNTSGQKDKATNLLNTILATEQNNAQALSLRGQIALEEKNYLAAITDFRQALKIKPEAVLLHRLLARSHALHNDLPSAFSSLEKAIEINPGDITVREDYMRLLAANQDIDGVVKQLDEILKIEPENLGAMQTLFQVQVSQKDWRSAETIVERMKESHPEKPLGYYFSGKLKQVRNQLEESIPEFQKAMELAPTAIQPLTELVKTYLVLKKPDDAMLKLNQTIEQYSDHFVAHNLLGEVYLFKNDVQQAQDSFNKAMTIKPDWPLPYRNAANVYLLNQDQTLAEMTYKEGIEKTNSAIILVTELAQLYQNQGKHEDAIKLYEKALKSEASNLVAINNLAMLLIDVRGDDASLKRAEHLLQPLVGQENFSFLDTIGWLKYKQGNMEAALENLIKAANMKPDSAEIQYHLGMAYLKNEDKFSAKAALLKATEKGNRFPGYDEAKAALENL